MRKILFLDIDGVLNPRWWENKFYKKPIDQFGYAFDSKCVANLAMIIKETKAEIVISSSWKFMGLAKLQEMWKDRHLPGKVVDVTPNSISDEFLLHADLDNMDMLSIRGQEIKDWLMLHGEGVGHYVILDDMNDVLREQEPHLVQIDPEVGITEVNARFAVMILTHITYMHDYANKLKLLSLDELLCQIGSNSYTKKPC